MNWIEIIGLIFGGSIAAGLLTFATMKAEVRKANSEADRSRGEADKARAEAEAQRLTNTENATRILMENIVKPLKEELHATREDMLSIKKELASTKREMARLRKAIDGANGCDYRDACPVLDRLRDISKTDRDDIPDDDADYGDSRQRSKRGANCQGGDDPDERGAFVYPSGQPP